MNSVLFAHGKEGNPNGKKAVMIAEMFAARIPKLTNSFETAAFINDLDVIEDLAENVDVVVGSSRGGALVCHANVNKPKILICPAWRIFDECLHRLPYLTERDVIIHSREDKIVPFEDSELLAETFGCTLIEAGHDHRMSDPETLNVILNTIYKALHKEER